MSLFSWVRDLFRREDTPDISPPAVRKIKVGGKWVPQDTSPPKFANNFLVNMSRDELQFFFSQTNFINDDADPSAFFVVAPHRLYDLQNLVNQAVTEYEKRYGSLKPSGPNDTPPTVLH